MRKTCIQRNKTWGRVAQVSCLQALAAGLLSLALAMPAAAGQREQAKRIHDRLTGVPPTESVLDDMVAELGASGAAAAGLLAMSTCAVESLSPSRIRSKPVPR